MMKVDPTVIPASSTACTGRVECYIYGEQAHCPAPHFSRHSREPTTEEIRRRPQEVERRWECSIYSNRDQKNIFLIRGIPPVLLSILR